MAGSALTRTDRWRTSMKESRHASVSCGPANSFFTYGIGSIVDLPQISVIVMGLEDWPSNADSTRVVEERLLAAVRAGSACKSACFAPPAPEDRWRLHGPLR